MDFLIFCLIQGGNSDDEFSDGLDDDKYDTRDSFIDDSELVKTLFKLNRFLKVYNHCLSYP